MIIFLILFKLPFHSQAIVVTLVMYPIKYRNKYQEESDVDGSRSIFTKNPLPKKSFVPKLKFGGGSRFSPSAKQDYAKKKGKTKRDSSTKYN